jgi:hypothetical protein
MWQNSKNWTGNTLAGDDKSVTYIPREKNLKHFQFYSHDKFNC